MWWSFGLKAYWKGSSRADRTVTWLHSETTRHETPRFLPCQGGVVWLAVPWTQMSFNISMLEESRGWCTPVSQCWLWHVADKDPGRRERAINWIHTHLDATNLNMGQWEHQLLTEQDRHISQPSSLGFHLRGTVQKDIIPLPFSFRKVECVHF